MLNVLQYISINSQWMFNDVERVKYFQQTFCYCLFRIILYNQLIILVWLIAYMNLMIFILFWNICRNNVKQMLLTFIKMDEMWKFLCVLEERRIRIFIQSFGSLDRRRFLSQTVAKLQSHKRRIPSETTRRKSTNSILHCGQKRLQSGSQVPRRHCHKPSRPRTGGSNTESACEKIETSATIVGLLRHNPAG